ncbi:Centromere protein X [Plasmopara halstedii]|uniref:Centromere protein X n=1 Tax=Plasmopara halstedii TaxID=4781 RepID=A0A0P1B4C5_PLAHL|nr:Centromere protein X [Plasmopara halstedii]CEG49212.1 Centromere protein X [Plasmopara halstedii]|eukprot:XP_024585581.1 Centromere protein X [Plasmopara halstedii]
MAPPTFKPTLVEQLFQYTWVINAKSAAGSFESNCSEDERSTDSAPFVSAAAAAARVRKIHLDAVMLSAETLRLFVIEACRRAQTEAMVDDSEQAEPQHVEQILAQLLLDF